jgi:hypothetical protein
MKLGFEIVLIAAAGALGPSWQPTWALSDAPNPVDVMTKNFYVTKVSGSTATIIMKLTTESGETRIRKTAGHTKLQKNGRDNSTVVRFLSPPDIKNTANQLIEHSDGDDHISIYLPALKKTRRIVASNKKDSFVRTDFSYGDVIGQKVEDWNHQLVREEVVDGMGVFIVESTPKNDAVKSASGYSKIIYTIRRDSFATMKSEYWDLGGRPLKVISYSDIMEVDPAHHKWQAMKIEAKNLQSHHKTELSFDSYKLDPDLKEDYFSTRYLEKEQ